MVNKNKFPIGRLVGTPGALEAFSRNSVEISTFIARHLSGDWGDVDREDAALNDLALTQGSRLLSAYTLPDKTRIWIITEADRSVTTVVLPSEY